MFLFLVCGTGIRNWPLLLTPGRLQIVKLWVGMRFSEAWTRGRLNIEFGLRMSPSRRPKMSMKATENWSKVAIEIGFICSSFFWKLPRKPRSIVGYEICRPSFLLVAYLRTCVAERWCNVFAIRKSPLQMGNGPFLGLINTLYMGPVCNDLGKLEDYKRAD